MPEIHFEAKQIILDCRFERQERVKNLRDVDRFNRIAIFTSQPHGHGQGQRLLLALDLQLQRPRQGALAILIYRR